MLIFHCRRFLLLLLFVAAWEALGAAEAAGTPPASARTNHAGRALPPLPPIKQTVLFNTPEADAILAAMQIFPKDNPWNEDISKRPLLANSGKMIAGIGADKKLAFNWDMCFIIVPPNQAKVDIPNMAYADESDKGPYPLPPNAPIEDWPMNGVALEKIQTSGEGDRHVLCVDPVNGLLYEFYNTRKIEGGWKADCEATFDLKSNKMRPKGWTSADAAGLPIFPAVVRFDECQRGMVEHAMRVTVRSTRREFIYPATHFASKNKDPDLPAMGQRLRLKAGVDISGLSPHAQAIALGLKKYGMFVADNGGDWRISVAPDARLKGLESLGKLKGSDFEVVETTGEHEGPRAPGTGAK